MAKPAKRRIEGTGDTRVDSDGGTSGDRKVTSRRVTPKGTQPQGGRYTPPTVKPGQELPSPTWVPVLMFTLLGLGLLVIVLSYAEVLPGAPSGWYLITGLVAILGGIITSTQLR